MKDRCELLPLSAFGRCEGSPLSKRQYLGQDSGEGEPHLHRTFPFRRNVLIVTELGPSGK